MPLLLLGLGLAGVAVIAAGAGVLSLIGARPAIARRLAGSPEVRVGDLGGGAATHGRPVRVAGRIRCREPLEVGGGERLVAYHRDVEVRIGRRWQPIERLRETRSFELWDHEGSVTIDPSLAAEPLIAIPHAWHGPATELEEPHASVVKRLADRHGPITSARAATRMINVTDRLLVLAVPAIGDDGGVRLERPRGGLLITNLALPEAMRLLAGRHRRLAAFAIIGQGIGLALAVIGTLGAVGAWLMGT